MNTSAGSKVGLRHRVSASPWETSSYYLDVLRGLGVMLSGIAVLIVFMFSVYALIVGPESFLAILIYTGLYVGAALAVIWVGVFVAHVIAKGVRLMGG
jgi:hypothetical protein